MKAQLKRCPIPILVIFFACLTTLPGILLGQQPTYHTFGKAEGLPSDNVYDALVDSDGFIWFSTDNGVSRFDGSVFQNFSLSDGLPDNEVFSLFLDSKRRLWFGTFNGVPGFYANGKFYNPTNSIGLQGVQNENYISAISESPQGTIYLGARDGRVYEIDFRGPARFVLQEIPSSMAAIGFRSDGTLEVSSSSCEILTLKNGVKKYHLLLPEMHPLIQEVMVVSRLRGGQYVLGYGAKVAVIGTDYSRINYVNKTLQTNDCSIIKIKEFQRFGVFLCTTKGAFLFQDLDFSYQNPTVFLPGKHVSSVCEDPEGGLWFTTNEGVYYAPEPSIRLGSPSQFTRSQNISSISPISKEKFVLGYNDGIISVVDRNNGEQFSFTGPRKGSYSLKANSFLSTEEGPLWVTTDSYLGIVDTQSRQVLPVLYVAGHDIAVFGDSLCFCHSFGWEVYSQSSLLTQAIQKKPTAVGNLHGFERCFSAHYDAKGALWVATNGGLSKILAGDTTKYDDLENRLGGSRITDITSDDDENVWLSTAGAGLIWIKNDSVLFLNSLYPDLPPNISQLSVVSDRLLGAASDQGFVLIGYSTQSSSVATTKGLGALDGLPSDQISDFFVLDSTLWIATPNGYSSFPMKMVFNRNLYPTVLINKFVYGSFDSIGKEDLRIAYDDQGVSIFFTGMSYRSLGEFKYKYNLSGLDDDWHYSSIGQVEYPFLEPGSYTFNVYSQNHQGNWSIQPASFRFTILTPFWRTTWFRILLVSSILLLILFAFRAYLENERKKERLRQKLNDAEQRALIGQMNPHFIFNSLNSIQQYYMTHELVHANEFLSEFGELIRSTLNNSRKPMVSLENEVSEIRTYLGLEALRLNQKFEYLIEIESDLKPRIYQIPTMLLQPFLENAIWHGVSPLINKQGMIMVRFSIENEMLRCEIEDNGIGRSKSRELRSQFGKKRKSHAMNIAEERIKLINGSGSHQILFEIFDIFDPDGIPAGTKIVLCFPIITKQGTDHEDN
jgi:ligand-binding sensor domain-containing protein